MGKKHHKDSIPKTPMLSSRSYLGYWIGGVVLVLIIGGGIFALSRYRNTGTSSPLTVRASDWAQGSVAAPVTLIEYGDFQCPSCGAYFPVIQDIQKAYGDQLRFVYREYPLVTVHANAFAAARAAEAAGMQAKFWEMHDLLFQNQAEWSGLSDPAAMFVQYAQSLQLDAGKFKADYSGYAVRDKVNASLKEGNRLGLQGTPTFYLNGQEIQNPQSEDAFKELINAAIKNEQLTAGSSTQAYHAHFNLRVSLGSTILDFTKPKYQSANGKELDASVHLHGNNGNVVHVHAEGVRLAYFFHTIGMTLARTSFTDDHASVWQNGSDGTLRLFVNGEDRTADIDTYVPQDLDRVLVIFGKQSSSQFTSEENRVADDACIYSLKCPERGAPPTEECIGGLGTTCAD